MNPGIRKFLVTAGVVAGALIVIGVAIRGVGNTPQPSNATVPAPTKPAPTGSQAQTPPTEAPAKPAEAAPATPPKAEPAIGAAAALTARPATPANAINVTHRATPIGSLDPATAPYLIEFATHAGGIDRITFADYWKTASAKEQAKRARKNANAGLPPDSDRYVLAETISKFEGERTITIPVFAAHSVEINGAPVLLFGNVWSEEAPGRFATELVDQAGTPRFRLEREYRVTANFDFALTQSIKNLSDAPATARLVQYGPGELAGERQLYFDSRRIQFGYLLPVARDPEQDDVLSANEMFERATLDGMVTNNQFVLWPNKDSQAGGFTMSWVASKDRYFALCMHAPWTANVQTRSIAPAIADVHVIGNGGQGDHRKVLTELYSPTVTLAPASAAAFNVDVYAGPLTDRVLAKDEPYASLNMSELIVYMLSGCCSFCSIGWIAHGMAWFLSFLHDYLVFDWGMAIIVLVIVVRLILHPIMKRSQIQMQRFSRGMAALKPELDALQKRYPNEPQRVQQEQLRLYREKGINPVGCVSGILPSLLQMPIWIALYAVLFFSFELRQSSAFYGLFQTLGGWQFLGDLSQPDNFFAFSQPWALPVLGWHLTGVNLLPLLLGFVFYFQQKYMTPPTANLTPEQETQQRMMKWMMIIMFPLMLYPQPSGLTLYILTSTCIGIWESKRVKKHIDEHGLEPKAKAGPKKQDRLGKMYEQMLERAREKQAQKNRKTYKERE